VTPATAVRQLLGPVTALAVVIGVVVILVLINGHHGDDAGSTSAVSARPLATPPVPTLAATTASSPSTGPRQSATARSSPCCTKRATHSAAATPSAPATPARTPVATALPPVQVLNNSRRTGLARSVAAQVHERGWPVTYVGNLRGRVIEPTIYYAPGSEPAAQQLAAAFPSFHRLLPQSAVGFHVAGLVLVLTRQYAG
jgi:hypothetical protein